jgi:hypothetical protein
MSVMLNLFQHLFSLLRTCRLFFIVQADGSQEPDYSFLSMPCGALGLFKRVQAAERILLTPPAHP